MDKRTQPTAKKSITEEEKVVLKKIGERLKKFRKEAGFTNYEYFAYENNISRPQYGKYEAGANIQLNTLIRILNNLNVSLEDFFKGM
ncbi:MAG: helix-turn-helix domain-containing protein [Crocinitomicaceae bacterium]|nr:helix-turn-helix domain-containing protein [Crocinitomicaceae bacterium]MCF8444871.1 helix-turn-helix domain-containing protein [Crocinitomicaceae bacterium]